MKCACLVVATAVVLCLALPAGALTFGGTLGADTLYLGCRTVVVKGVSYKELEFCNHTTGATSHPYYHSCRLSDDIQIMASGGNDYVQVLVAGQSVTGANACGSPLSGEINYIEDDDPFIDHWVDVYGEAGNDDTLYGGDYDSLIDGGSGADHVVTRSGSLAADGSTGDDFVWSVYAPDGDTLYGGDGVDCLEEAAYSSGGYLLAASFNCGLPNDGQCYLGTGDCYVPLTGVDLGTEVYCETVYGHDPGCNDGIP